jgi:hypothetical protein
VNITQRFGQIALAAILGASYCSLGSASANAFTFQETGQAKLEFFDTSGTLVGNGGMTYKPFSGSFVSGGNIAVYESADNPLPPPEGGVPFFNSRRYTPPADYAQITSFSADLFTVGFTIPSQSGTVFNLTTTGQSIVGQFVYFWKPPAAETFTGGTGDTLLRVDGGGSRHPGMGEGNGWIGCLPACGFSQRQVYTIRSDGTWDFFGPPASGIGSNLNINGTWRATAIPEPGTLAGSIAAAIVIWRLKQHRGDKGNA